MILAILAGCQTLTMLTGGIDLSVGAVASMSGFVVATLAAGWGMPTAIVVALAAAALAGLLTGIGVGVFRVHPLIMTLGMGLVVLGFANVWQLRMVQTGAGVPDLFRWLGSGLTMGIVPNSLLVFVPLAAVVLVGLRRSGYGRLLYAIGDNPIAARLSGARAWQVLVVLYILSALMAAVAGFLLAGLTNIAAVTLADSVCPAVGRGGGDRRDLDHGRARRLRWDDRGGAHPDRPLVAAVCPRLAGGGPPDPLRLDHRCRGGRVHAHHLGILTRGPGRRA